MGVLWILLITHYLLEIAVLGLLYQLAKVKPDFTRDQAFLHLEQCKKKNNPEGIEFWRKIIAWTGGEDT
jgi:hypothetical protein